MEAPGATLGHHRELGTHSEAVVVMAAGDSVQEDHLELEEDRMVADQGVEEDH